MMDMQLIAQEIGLFETAMNLSKVSNSEEAVFKAGMSMPFPPPDIERRIGEIAGWLLSFEKDAYLFLTPEIALIEEMNTRSGGRINKIITVPKNMDEEAKTRLQNNLPDKRTYLLEEPFFPGEFYPRNGMIVACGYSECGRNMVLSDTYRMVEHYGIFQGKTAFLPYIELDFAYRLPGWFEVKQSLISDEWRGGEWKK